MGGRGRKYEEYYILSNAFRQIRSKFKIWSIDLMGTNYPQLNGFSYNITIITNTSTTHTTPPLSTWISGKTRISKKTGKNHVLSNLS